MTWSCVSWCRCWICLCFFFFFFNDTATTEIYTRSLHDALPIWMYPDFKELLSVFNAHSVKYLIVGGSVSLYAQPRSTKDIDLLVRPDAGNAKAVYAALAQFGAPT